MTIDPYPCNRTDPAWDSFTAAHTDRPAAPAQPLPQLDVASLIGIVQQTQQIQGAITQQPGRVPLWARGDTAKVAYWGAVVPTLVTGAANLSVHHWGMAGPAWTGAIATGLSVAAGIAGLNHHWDMRASALLLGFTIGSVTFSVAATGSGWTDVAAWLIGVAGTIGFKIVWNRKHAADKAKVALTEAKAATELAKRNAVMSKSAITDAMALLKLQELQRQAQQSVATQVICATPEEAALRQAVRDVFDVDLVSCDVRYTLTGYVATAGLPVALGRDTARNSWDKVSSALRANGRFLVSDGQLTNELEVKFLDRSKVNTDELLWDPSVMPDDRVHLAAIGINTETGEPVLVQFDERLLLCGASGTGKSWTSRPLLAHAHLNGDLVMLDGKGEEGNVWDGICRVGRDGDEIEVLIDTIHDEMNRRRDIMRALGTSVWDGRQLTVFIDEGQVILALVSGDKDRMQRLRELASLGRSRGIVLWWATQKPTMSGTAPGIDSQMAGNLLQRFSLRVATEQEARTALDDCAHYAPNLIPAERSMRSHGYLKGFGPCLIRAYKLDDAAVKRLPVSIWQGASEESPDVRIRQYMEANPKASQVAMSRDLGIPRSTLQGLLKGL